jgi:hypothetical protein
MESELLSMQVKMALKGSSSDAQRSIMVTTGDRGGQSFGKNQVGFC